ncbi:HupE/UreJ family protein [Laceyella putida]|uniref:HupE/UreJ family protein n=1 Tax=Laceyella putida TaxID=110101 RepID=A0ABW2RLL5_9BACL
MKKRGRWGCGWIFILVLCFLLPPYQGSAHPLTLVSTKAVLQEKSLSVQMLVEAALLKRIKGVELEKGSPLPPQVKSKLQQVVSQKFQISNEGKRMQGRLEDVRWLDHTHLKLHLTYSSNEKLGKLTFVDDLFFDVAGKQHQNVLTLVETGIESTFVFSQSARELTFHAGTALSWWVASKEFFQLGVEHIWFGFDHLAFLFALLLVRDRWQEMVKVITSFTIAHSITLFLAMMNILAIPSKWVEALIALSILIVALENLWLEKGEPWLRRWVITFYFGLIHGLGFAGSLADIQLPKNHLLTALFSFNMGIEAGQLVIVALVWPLLAYLWRQRAFIWVARGLTLVIALLGLAWFVERAFEWDIPFFDL